MKPDPCSKQRCITVVENVEVFRRNHEPRRVSPPQGMHIAKASMTTLDVGFQGIGDLTCRRLAFLGSFTNLGEPLLAAPAPGNLCLFNHLPRHSFVAGKKSSGDET